MKRLGDRFFKWCSAVSAMLGIATLALWAVCRNDLHQIIWFIGDTRYCLFSYGGSLGFEVLEKWPYHGAQPVWGPIDDNSAYIPVFTVILLFAVLPSLRLRQRWISRARSESRTATTIISDAIFIAAGKTAFLWFVFYWLSVNQDDDPAFFFAGSFGIALPVLVMWFGWRDIIRFPRTPPPPGICLTCGYDLRATPDRCPECGAIPKKRPIWLENEPQIGDEPGK